MKSVSSVVPTSLKPNPAWASLPLFDRTGWKRMTFGEFAESIGERAEPKDAEATGTSIQRNRHACVLITEPKTAARCGGGHWTGQLPFPGPCLLNTWQRVLRESQKQKPHICDESSSGSSMRSLRAVRSW